MVGPPTKLQAEAGQEFARDFVGAAISGYPMAVGSMYGEAINRGDPNSGDAAQAFALGPAYAALDGLQPAQLKGLVTRGQTGGAVKRILSATLAGGAGEMPQEALQTAMELSFRPDMSMQDKIGQIVEAAITGGAVGGTLGGLAGIRKAKDLNALPTEELEKGLDAGLAPTAAPEAAPAPAPPHTLTGEEEQPKNRPLLGQPIEQLTSQLMQLGQKLADAGGARAEP